MPIARSWWSLALLGALGTPAEAQLDSLTARLRELRLTMAATGAGQIEGPGAELLIEAARAAQFTLIGEEHGVAEVPLVAGALLERLVPAGYRHVAIETSAALAGALQEQFRSGADYASWLRQHHPAVAFYNWRQEAEFARRASELLPVPDALWGLDYDITADRYAFRRLRSLAPDEAAAAVVDRVIERGDSALSVALSTSNPGAAMMWGGPDDVYAELMRALRPPPGSEAENIIYVSSETRAINGDFLAGRNYESNLRRAQLNKAQFLRYYRAAEAREGRPPRVLLKFGASHMYRGRSQTNVFDVGNLASELAESLGNRSFHVLVIAGPGSQVAAIDPTVFGTISRPATALTQSWLEPFLDALDPAAWNIFDLRPLRPLNQSRQFGTLPEQLNRLLYAFDAVVILGGSTPQEDLTGLPLPRSRSRR